MKKREHDHFIGLWRHPKGGWEIKYQQCGKQISEYRQDETEAKLRAEYWKATLSGPPEESYDEHVVYYWERMLRRVAETLLANPSNRELAAACRSVAAAATAALRTAKYIPAPRQAVTPDSAPIDGSIESLTTEQLQEIAGVTNTPSEG